MKKMSIRAILALSLVLLCTVTAVVQAQVADQAKQTAAISAAASSSISQNITDSGFACVPALQTAQVGKPATMQIELTQQAQGATQQRLLADLYWLVEANGRLQEPDPAKPRTAVVTFDKPGSYRVALIRHNAAGVATGLAFCRVNVIAQQRASATP